MSERTVARNGRHTLVLEEGQGDPLVYLHGFADVHGAVESWQPFHQQLQQRFRVIAPAHPGCAGSDGMREIDTVEDVIFHYLDLFEALGLERLDLVGTCVGGWLAAEFAIRYPERVRRLVLVGATGLHVSGAPIGDVFMLSRDKDGGDHSDIRQLLFASADAPVAHQYFPNVRASIEQELLRYKMLTFAGRIGWSPPYLYDPKLRGRLGRITSPTLLVWGEQDRLVPLAHGHAYAKGMRDARLEIVAGAGHAVHLEQPEQAAQLLTTFLT